MRYQEHVTPLSQKAGSLVAVVRRWLAPDCLLEGPIVTLKTEQGTLAQLASTPPPRREQGPQEIVLDGRRYALVPVVERSQAEASNDAEIEASSARIRALSSRERGIVELVSKGYVNKQIASELRISEHTVSTHMRRIFAKLGVDTRAAMVSCFFKSQ